MLNAHMYVHIQPVFCEVQWYTGTVLGYNKSITVKVCKGCSGTTTVSFRVCYKLKVKSIGLAETLIIGADLLRSLAILSAAWLFCHGSHHLLLYMCFIHCVHK